MPYQFEHRLELLDPGNQLKNARLGRSEAIVSSLLVIPKGILCINSNMLMDSNSSSLSNVCACWVGPNVKSRTLGLVAAYHDPQCHSSKRF